MLLSTCVPNLSMLNYSLMIILGLLLRILRAGDVEVNPGPRLPKFPCGECKKACTDYRGAKSSILCEQCNTWFHIVCIGMSDDMFSCLSRSDIPWECTNCGLPNISTSLFDSTINDDSLSDSDTNTSNTSSITSSDPGSPSAQSSPSKSSARTSQSATNLRTLEINFQKIFNKRAEFWSIIDAVKPDIIFGCETWLSPGVNSCEIFPPNFNVYRKDRKDGYGGVLLGINSSLISHQLDISSEAEFIAAKILSGKQSIIVGALYRPTDNNQLHLDSLNQTIEDICTTNQGAAIWIAGDINLPDILLDYQRDCWPPYRKGINESFLQLLAKTGLEQIVDFPTRLDNTLDVIITNRPSLVNRCESMPGLSDHDIVYADWNILAKRRKPVRRKVYLWKRTEFDAIRVETQRWTDNFVATYSPSTPVEKLASEIELHLENTLQNQVPSKFTSTRYSQPWFSTATKRICRRKARAFKKARLTTQSVIGSDSVI